MKFSLFDLVVFVVVGAFLFWPSGSDPKPNKPDDPDKPAPQVQVTESDIWLELADSVKAGNPNTLDELSRVVLSLASRGFLSENALAAYEAAFPDARESARDLVDADAETLIGLGK